MGQRVIVGTLEDIAQRAKAEEVKAPATIVVGEVVHTLNPRKERDSAKASGDLALSSLADKLLGESTPARLVDERQEVGDSSGAGPLLHVLDVATTAAQTVAPTVPVA